VASPYGYEYGRPVGMAVIRALGGKVTPEKLRFFSAWAQAEGTKAQYNPFATTRKGFQGETQFNSVGVKNYPDLKTGIKATVDTLKLSYYTSIVDLIRSPNATAEDLAKAVAASPWGTGTGVLRVLGVADVEGYEKARSTAQYGEKKAALEVQYTTTTLNRFAPSQGYMQALSRTPATSAALRVASGFQPFTLTEEVPVAGDTGPQVSTGKQGAKFSPEGGFLQLPTLWSGTHVTDNLGWGTKTAQDIMGKPGTVLGAMENGRIEEYDPEGAQGGGSMVFIANSGREYWLGHITNGLAPGTRVKRGQRIAVISGDHDRPHVHIDVRTPRKGKR